jgi:hypothetical protein
MVSPLSSTPAPPAPSAQCTTALPGKWPPHWIRVTPFSTSRVPDQVVGGRSGGQVSQAASASGTSTSASKARLHSAIDP